eukprot:CAMPEP_0174927852 /NCGR_PEP_ID=MMETSP1355-20121228/21556_1 /TAXON_ID=464990 /ORGANISM="Hemiselmis tepida, Strain CCMP443" /LENGTH=65 /DNA_ID=CAMNT_0016173985 /DNA_START=400 /DNA_END=597 /DNA_ORIENTATION=-
MGALRPSWGRVGPSLPVPTRACPLSATPSLSCGCARIVPGAVRLSENMDPTVFAAPPRVLGPVAG